MKTGIILRDSTCKINFAAMTVQKSPKSLDEALKGVEPFPVSDDVASGESRLIVSAGKGIANV